ncbi:MAG: DUF3048 domain-containing protein [Acidimicrobiales bacterium]
MLISFGLFAGSLTPAAAQDEDEPGAPSSETEEDPADEIDDLTKLRGRRDAIPVEIELAQAELITAEQQVAEFAEGVASTEIQLELLIDDLTRAVEARDVPQRIQHEAAIARYVNGDPRTQAFLAEIDSVNADIEPQNRQHLYTVVVEDAGNDIETARQRLRDLQDAVGSLRNSQRARFDELDNARSDRAAAASRLSSLEENAEAVDLRIAWLESLLDRWVLTGVAGDSIDRPALAMKIDNVDEARPQSGINQADLVFEEQVEGGFTRLVAIFHSEDATPVGPIRSTRTSDIEILSNLRSPLFGNSGGNQGAMRALRRSELINVGVDAETGAYFRSNRAAPHNLYSNTDELWDRAASKSSSPPPQLRFRNPGDPLPDTAVPIAGVTVPFTRTSIEYRWNGSGWERSQNGTPHVDADGVRVAPVNVIIQFVGYRPSPADGASPEAIMVGGAPAWILIDGSLIEGTWNRPRITSATIFRDLDGNLLELNPGKTWITLARTNRASIIE